MVGTSSGDVSAKLWTAMLVLNVATVQLIKLLKNSSTATECDNLTYTVLRTPHGTLENMTELKDSNRRKYAVQWLHMRASAVELGC